MDKLEYIYNKTSFGWKKHITLFISIIGYSYMQNWTKYIFLSLLVLEIIGFILLMLIPRKYLLKLYLDEYDLIMNKQD